MSPDRFRKTFLLLLLVIISIGFLLMIRRFLMALLLAAIFSGLLQPVYARGLRLFRGRRAPASLCTLLLFVIMVLGPVFTFFGLVASEALRVSEEVTPWVQEQIAEPDKLTRRLDSIPGIARLEPYRDQILAKVGQLVGSGGRFLFDKLSATTQGTVSFFFQFFIMVYAQFFFLMDGKSILRKILEYMPLPDADEKLILDKFLSVTRATIKGTLVIGIAQGTLAGIAFAIAGITGALFWGTVMAILSIIPGIGAALVWVPAVIILFVTGRMGSGIFLGLFCAVVVGTIDNFLRPRLVGHDVKMHELLILVGTLGGIYLFGAVGFIVGPILAALFVTIWDIYGVVFRDALPRVGLLAEDEPVKRPAPAGKRTKP
ncbi:MAG: AI-2E family transporter [Candidatus Krumholzibacteriia bacterium]